MFIENIFTLYEIIFKLYFNYMLLIQIYFSFYKGNIFIHFIFAVYVSKFVGEDLLPTKQVIDRVINQHCGEIRKPRRNRFYAKDELRKKIRQLKAAEKKKRKKTNRDSGKEKSEKIAKKKECENEKIESKKKRKLNESQFVNRSKKFKNV